MLSLDDDARLVLAGSCLRWKGFRRAGDGLYACGIDRYGGDVAEFLMTGVAAGPDGRQLYRRTERGVLILERTPSP